MEQITLPVNYYLEEQVCQNIAAVQFLRVYANDSCSRQQPGDNILWLFQYKPLDTSIPFP